jgi:hypothetical protein
MRDRLTIAWVLWIAGTVLIAASWTGTVPVKVGWVGFGVALLGTFAGSYGPKHPPATKPDDQPSDESTQS